MKVLLIAMVSAGLALAGCKKHDHSEHDHGMTGNPALMQPAPDGNAARGASLGVHFGSPPSMAPSSSDRVVQ